MRHSWDERIVVSLQMCSTLWSLLFPGLLQGVIFSAVTSCYEVSSDSTTRAGMTDRTAALCLRKRKLHVAFTRWEIFGESANMLYLVITRLQCRRWRGGCVCYNFGYAASCDSTAIAGITDRTATFCLRILELYAPEMRDFWWLCKYAVTCDHAHPMQERRRVYSQ